MYLHSVLKSEIATGIHGSVSDANSLILINEAAREVFSDVDLRSAIRKTALAPNLFDEIYEYSCPTDLKGTAIIDIKPQVNRESTWLFDLTSQEEFDRIKDEHGLVAFSENSLTRKLLISADIDDDSLTVSGLNSITDSGTWTLYGDGTNLTTDSDNFVKGSGSINWDISAAGGTTAGIYASDIDTFDLTDYTQGSIFVWAYITSATDLTNYIIRIGSSASNYFTKTVTTTNEGTAFVAGWNLLRFDLASATQTGTVDLDACVYCAIFMTKAVGKISETDYRFDHIIVKNGEFHDLIYYSSYPFQSSTGTWLQDSTATTDYINCNADELRLVSIKAQELCSVSLENYSDADRFASRYKSAVEQYKLKYPSQAKILITTI